jgi:hypothetical protein
MKGQTMIATVNGKNRTPTPVVITPQARQAKLGQTLRDLRRRFGENAIMQLSETSNLKVEVISTGYAGDQEQYLPDRRGAGS